MANALELYQQEYDNNIHQRYQQTKPRLSEFLEWDSFVGERKDYPRAAVAAGGTTLSLPNNYNGVTNNDANRFPATPINQAQFDKRWIYYGDPKFKVKHFTQWDATLLGNISLPNSSVQREHMNGYAQDCDDVVWTAALGNAKEGRLGTTDVALPAGQKIAAGGTGFTLAKLMATLDILDNADALDEENMRRVIVWTVKQRSALLNTTEVKSSDYNTVKALAEGEINSFMGFEFKLVKRLPLVSGTRTCVAWQTGALMGSKIRMPTKFSERGDIHNALQVYDSWMLGAVRLQDEGVVQIDCAE